MPTSERTYNQIAGQKVQRVEALSDGVFAVALTLLVLDIKTPANELIHSEKDLMAMFCALTPKFLTYFLSFMTLGIFWMGQTVQFSYIHKGDRNLNWISLFFLLVVSILPFTTAFLSEHLMFRFAIGVYWLNIFLLGLMLFIQWNYAYKHGHTNIPDEEKEMVNRAVRKRIIFAQMLYAAGALLCLVNNYLSIFVIISVQLNYALAIFSGRRQKKKPK